MNTYTVVITNVAGAQSITVTARTGIEALRNAIYSWDKTDDYSITSITLTKL